MDGITQRPESLNQEEADYVYEKSFLALTAKPIPYHKELRQYAESVTAAILWQQLEYWFSRTAGKPFYKYLSPCQTGKGTYKEGDSWTEELGFSEIEFRNAFDKIGVRYTSKTQYIVERKRGQAFKGKMYCSFSDKKIGLTFYVRNHKLVQDNLSNLVNPVSKSQQATKSLEMSKPHLQEMSKPNLQEINKAHLQEISKPNLLEISKPHLQEMSKPNLCNLANLISRDEETQSLEMSKPHFPYISENTTKNTSETTTDPNGHSKSIDYFNPIDNLRYTEGGVGETKTKAAPHDDSVKPESTVQGVLTSNSFLSPSSFDKSSNINPIEKPQNAKREEESCRPTDARVKEEDLFTALPKVMASPSKNPSKVARIGFEVPLKNYWSPSEAIRDKSVGETLSPSFFDNSTKPKAEIQGSCGSEAIPVSSPFVTQVNYQKHEALESIKGEKDGSGQAKVRPKLDPRGRSKEPASSDEALRLSLLLGELILANNPNNRELKNERKSTTFRKWSLDMDKMIRLDDRQVHEVEVIMRWAQSDPFWKTNILSASTLRKQYDRLKMQMIRIRPSREADGDGNKPSPPVGRSKVMEGCILTEGNPPYQEIIDDLNLKSGKIFRVTGDVRDLIDDLWKEGFSLDDFKKTHDNMAKKWRHNPDMNQYLRPSTLYNPAKFQGYLNCEVFLSDLGIISKKTDKGLAAVQEWINEKRKEE